MSGSGIVSAQGTVVFGLPPAPASADPLQPVAQRSTLSPDASPFVPKNFAVSVVAAGTPQAPFAAASTSPAAATVADSDVTYPPPLPPPNVQTFYITGLPGYYAPYVPTPAVPFYTMQYQCLYPPTPPMGVCCPMEESMPAVADEPPIATMVTPATAATSVQQQSLQQLQQPMIQNARRNKKKSRSGRRRESASHRDSMVDGNTSVMPDFGQASGRNGGVGGARVTAVDQEEWQGGPASPDFSSSSEFPSLPVQDFPQRQSPSGISYSTALQQQKAPRTPAAPSGVTTNRETEELASPSAVGGNTRSSMQQQGRRSGGNNGGNSQNDANNKHHKRSNGSRKHRRGGGGGGASDGVRRVEDAEPSARLQHHQQERRGSKRSGGGKANVPAIDGGAEKHQFEAPEKDKSELRHDTEAIVANAPRERIGSGRMPHQNGVRVNAARGRRETRPSSLLRGVLKGDGGRQHHQQGGRGGGSRKGSDSDRHLPVSEDGQQEVDKPALRRSWNSGSPARQKDSVDEYPPLGSRGTEDSLERSPDARMTKADTKDAMVKQGDNIPKQQPQTPFREKGSKPVKPLASTNGGSAGPKHKTAISMAIADIMVPKQRQPKKLKEKENLLERSSKKPEVGSWQP
uniref:Selenocysteine insertion sequence-binding protein 2 n=1 Tax=Rhipicephalus appendiculatus TaxID=34631 RepID=A0A131YCQ9_RHIAP